MKKQKKLIVGNWKMNPVSVEEAKKLASSIKRAVAGVKRTNVVLCPPFVYISTLSGLPKGSLFLGAQDANPVTLGAFTGEVSFSELYQFGVRYVIVGHSERRKMGETDELINKKVKAVASGGMTAIVCIGESTRDHNGDYLGFIRGQIISALKDLSKKFLPNIVIAYEPIWAIGAPEAMKPRDLHEMSIFIRKVLKDLFGVLSDDIQVIYGGAVDRVNADSIVKDGNVSGLLIGRQSLSASDFIEIVKLIDQI